MTPSSTSCYLRIRTTPSRHAPGQSIVTWDFDSTGSSAEQSRWAGLQRFSDVHIQRRAGSPPPRHLGPSSCGIPVLDSCRMSPYHTPGVRLHSSVSLLHCLLVSAGSWNLELFSELRVSVPAGSWLPSVRGNLLIIAFRTPCSFQHLSTFVPTSLSRHSFATSALLTQSSIPAERTRHIDIITSPTRYRTVIYRRNENLG